MAVRRTRRRHSSVDHRDEEIYAKHADELLRFATTLVGPSAAEDVFAAAIVRAMTSPAWAAVTDPRPYLFRAVLNEARSMRRSGLRRVAREQRAARPATLAPTTLSVEVADAMRRLSVRERSVLYLAYWLELPAAEIARTLDLSVRTTERALRSARTHLEESLR